MVRQVEPYEKEEREVNMSNQDDRTPRLMTYAETAAHLSVPIGTLYAWVHEGRIPHIRLSARTVRFEEFEIQAWLSRRRVVVAAQR